MQQLSSLPFLTRRRGRTLIHSQRAGIDLEYLVELFLSLVDLTVFSHVVDSQPRPRMYHRDLEFGKGAHHRAL
jgi:hypothetical protein